MNDPIKEIQEAKAELVQAANNRLRELEQLQEFVMHLLVQVTDEINKIKQNKPIKFTGSEWQ